MSEVKSQIPCNSIFKDGKTTTSKDKFTSAWINLINQLEKSKNYTSSSKSYADSSQ